MTFRFCRVCPHPSCGDDGLVIFQILYLECEKQVIFSFWSHKFIWGSFEILHIFLIFIYIYLCKIQRVFMARLGGGQGSVSQGRDVFTQDTSS